MIRRNAVRNLIHAMCLIVMGMLPVSALADNPMVIHEVKHDRSQPLRDMAVSVQSVPSAQQQATFPKRTGSAITSSQPDPVAQILSGAPVSIRVGLNFDGLSAAD